MARRPRKSSLSRTAIAFDAPSGTLRIAGTLRLPQFMEAERELQKQVGKAKAVKHADLRDLLSLDSAGALLLAQWIGDAPPQWRDDSQQRLMALVAQHDEVPLRKAAPAAPLMRRMMVCAGRWAEKVGVDTRSILTFFGKSAVLMARALRHPKQLRLAAIAQQVEQIGIHALPIIGLMAFLISIVLAYQGVAQLRPYGGEQFTINLVALSIMREMGVLLTAIMVAGRSGSAFTAEIGLMKTREEVDALQVMGMDAFAMLVLPRLIAIIIVLPLLTFFANMMGLLGGYIILHSLIDTTPIQYIERVHFAASGSDLFVGLIKAPVFALFIGVVGCMHGLNVTGSAESLGRETTVAVVKSIFIVLVLDAVFSILFENLGL